MPSIAPRYTLLAERPGPGFPDVDASALKRYSLTRALRVAAGAVSPRGLLEGEVHEALERAVSRALGPKRGVRGVLVPLGAAGSGVGGAPRAALDSGTSGAGQELVFTEAGSFLDGLRARSVATTLGATILETPLPTSEPRLDADVVTDWLAEDGPAMGDTEPTLGSVNYTLRTLGANVPYSRQLLAESFGLSGADQIVARAAEGALGAALDLAAIQGTGTNNQPTGVLNTAGIGSVPIGTNGGAPTWAHLVDLEHEVAIDDADAGRLGFATTPGVRRALRKTERAAGSGVVWPASTLLGYPAAVSRNVPSDLTKGTGSNLHAIILGNWADLAVAMLPVLDVVVDPYTKKKQGLIEVSFFMFCDVQVRRPESFAAVKDAVA